MTMHANRAGVSKLWLLNLFGNALALAAWYFWLLIPDAHAWQVAGSVLLVLAIIFIVVWLRAGTLAYFRLAEFREAASIWPAFRRGLRHIPALVVWVLAAAVVEWCLWRLRGYAPQYGVWLWQKLPDALRILTPRQIAQWTDWKLLLFFWYLVPAIFLPMATTLAAKGFAGAARSFRVLKRPLYWLWFAALMLVGAYIPYKLIGWVNYSSDLRAQAWSAGLRFFAAYVIVVSAWLALVWMTGRHVEREDAG